MVLAMRYTFFALLLLLCVPCMAQPMKRVSQLYKDGNYEEAMEASKRLLNTKDSADACELIGRIYVERLQPDSGMVYSQRAIAMDADRTWVSAWAHTYLGSAWLLKGDKEKATAELNKTIALAKTQNSVNNAKGMLADLDAAVARMEKRAKGLSRPDSMAKLKWITIEGEYINFNFEDTAGWGGDVAAYISEHEQAYAQLNKIFRAKLPQKLTFYVWVDMARAEAILGARLGFTDPHRCICYVHPRQTKGHEMMHALSHWAWGKPVKYKTKFISEGTSVAFDLRNISRVNEAKKALEGQQVKSITEIWERADKYNDDVVYGVGGAFVEYLYERSSKKQFQELVKCQSIECARITYGYTELNALIKEFDNILGLGQ